MLLSHTSSGRGTAPTEGGAVWGWWTEENREEGSEAAALAEAVKSCETPRYGAPAACRLISERGIGVVTVSVSEVEGPGAGPQCPRNPGGSQRKLALGMSVQDPGPVASEWAQAAPQRRHSGTGAQYWDFEQEPKGEKPQSRDESSVMGNVIRGGGGGYHYC